MFAFFLESSFLALLLGGEKRFGRTIHDLAAWASWEFEPAPLAIGRRR